jgi:hypothetical protein
LDHSMRRAPATLPAAERFSRLPETLKLLVKSIRPNVRHRFFGRWFDLLIVDRLQTKISRSRCDFSSSVSRRMVLRRVSKRHCQPSWSIHTSCYERRRIRKVSLLVLPTV